MINKLKTLSVFILLMGFVGVSFGEKIDWERMANPDFVLTGYPMDMGYRLSKSEDPELRGDLYSGLTGSPDKWTRNNCAIAASYLNDDQDLIKVVSIAFQHETDGVVKKSLFKVLSVSSSDNNIPVLVSIIDQYKSLTTEPDMSYRQESIKSLANFRDKGWPFLEGILAGSYYGDSDKVIAVKALASSNTTQVIPVLLQFHTDSSALVRNHVVQSLGELSKLSLNTTLKQRVFEALSQRVEDSDPTVRMETLRAFIQLQDERALPIIERVTVSDSHEVKTVTIQQGQKVVTTRYPVRELAFDMKKEYQHIKTLRENPDLQLLMPGIY